MLLGGLGGGVSFAVNELHKTDWCDFTQEEMNTVNSDGVDESMNNAEIVLTELA